MLRKRVYYISPIDIFFGAFLVWYGGVYLFKSHSMDKWSVIQFVSYMLLYFYFRNVGLKKHFFLLLFCSGLIQAIWNCLQLLGALPSYHYLLKGTGCFFNPAILGIFLVLSFQAGIILFDRNLKMRLKLLWGCGMLLLFSGIILSGSRASWIALLAGLCWIFFISKSSKFAIYIRIAWEKHRLLKQVCLLFLGAIAILGIACWLYYMRPGSVHGRWLIWQVVWNGLSDSLWCGHGPLRALYMPFQAAWFQVNSGSGLAQVADNNIYAFNEFLQIAFEAGITGLLLFAGLVITGCYYAFKGSLSSGHAGGLLFAVVCFGLFSYPFSIVLINMVVVILLAFIAQNVPLKKQIPHRAGVFVRYGFLSGSLLLLIFTIPEYRLRKKVDRLLMKARYDSTVLTDDFRMNYYNRLQGNPDFVLCYGRMLYDSEAYKEAQPVLEQAYWLKPSSELVCDLGMCYRYNQQYSRAEQAYILAARMTPAYILPHYHLFCLYLETGDRGKAREMAERMLAMPVKVVNTSVLRYRGQARLFLKDNELSE